LAKGKSYVGARKDFYGTITILKDGSEVFDKCGRCVYIRKVLLIHETNEIFYELEYEFNGYTMTETLPRADLRKNVLLTYASKGMDALEHTVHTLLKYLQNQEKKVPVTIGHKHVGFDTAIAEDGEYYVFKGHEGVGFVSEYRGGLDIEPRGEIEEYQIFIKEYITGTALELSVAVGLAGLLVGFVGAEIECDNLFVHLFGDSSSGKTTFAVVAVGMGSRPVFKGHTLMRRYSGTENALMGLLVGNTGLPVCFDEAKSAKIRDFSSFIYSVESGVEKLRLDKDASLKSTGEYHTSIISTGEFSLSDGAEHATGKEIRLQQFGNIKWTNGAQQSEEIKKFFRSNYALPCVLLAQYLLEIGADEAVECFEKNRKIFLKHSKVQDAFSERLSIKYGVILATVELANKALGFDLSYDLILDMLVQNEIETADSRDLAQVAFDYIIGQCNVYRAYFSRVYPNDKSGSTTKDSHKDVWGIIETLKQAKDIDGKLCYEIIYVDTDIMKELLQKGKFKDVDVIIKKWKERNLLEHEADRNYIRRKTSSKATAKSKLYGLRVFGEPNSNEEPNPNKPQKMLERTNLLDILQDDEDD